MHKKIFFLNKQIIKSYILLMPFISAFAISPWLPLPLVFMMIASIYVISSSQLKIFTEDWEIFLVIALGIVGFIFSTSYFGAKNINHSFAILSSVLFFYVIPKSLLIKFKSIDLFVGTIVISLAIVSAAVSVEFIGSNYFGINFSDFIPYNSGGEVSDATVNGILIRPRGFAEEAGHMSLFYEMSLPLSILYFKNKRFIFQFCYYIPVVTTFILLFSSAAFVSIIIAVIALFLLKYRLKKSLVLFAIMIIVLVVIMSSDVTKPYLEATIGTRIGTFLDPSQQDNFSMIDRSNRYNSALTMFVSAPFGIGWGMTSQLALESQTFAGVKLQNAGLISLYLEVLIACGFLGLILFVKFLGKKMVQLIKTDSFESDMVFVSVLSISLHYIFISNYWFPMLWFPLALADTVRRGRDK